jgi:hypothetical protein
MVKIRIFKCISLFVFLFASAFGAPPSYAAGLPLPGGWIGGETFSARLDTVSGNQGFWSEARYVTDGGLPIHAILMGGKGASGKYIPEAGINSSDGPLGDGASFAALAGGGRAVIIERHPITGTVIAVNLRGATLTLETDFQASDRDMIKAATALADCLPDA